MIQFVWIYGLLWLTGMLYWIYAKKGQRWLGWMATAILWVCLGLLTAHLVQRGFVGGHWPLSNRYEFSLCFLWWIIGVYLLLEISWREQRCGFFIVGIALIIATYTATRSSEERQIVTLLPILRSVYLQLHVVSASIGYGILGVAAGLGLVRVSQYGSDRKNVRFRAFWSHP